MYCMSDSIGTGYVLAVTDHVYGHIGTIPVLLFAAYRP